MSDVETVLRALEQAVWNALDATTSEETVRAAFEEALKSWAASS